MTDSWTETTLGEVIELYDHKRIPLSTQERSQRQGEYPYYGASGVIDAVDDYIFDGRYLLISEDGANLVERKAPIAFFASGKFWVNNHAHVVRAIPGVANDYFLMSCIQSANISGYITGTAQPKLSQRNLKAIRLTLPSFPTQRKIAAILSAYDALIENNTRRIKILEDMAATIYRQWFVEFRFPGHENVRMVESELGLIPQGWEVGKLGDVIENIKVRVMPGRHLEQLPYVPIDCIPRRSIALVAHKPFSEAKSSLIAFKRNDILFGAMRSYFHKVIFAPFDGITRQTCFVLRSKNPDNAAFDLFTMFQDSTIEYSSNHSTGSTIPYATWDGVLDRMPILNPPEPLIAQFTEVVTPMLDSIRALVMKYTNLRQSRDLLLPKLISGEIDVSKLNIVTEGV